MEGSLVDGMPQVIAIEEQGRVMILRLISVGPQQGYHGERKAFVFSCAPLDQGTVIARKLELGK